MRFCPRCQITQGGHYCSRCGVSTVPDQTERKCPRCGGGFLFESANFCFSCGWELVRPYIPWPQRLGMWFRRRLRWFRG